MIHETCANLNISTFCKNLHFFLVTGQIFPPVTADFACTKNHQKSIIASNICVQPLNVEASVYSLAHLGLYFLSN